MSLMEIVATVLGSIILVLTGVKWYLMMRQRDANYEAAHRDFLEQKARVEKKLRGNWENHR